VEILKIPNPILTSKAETVTDFSGLESFTSEMIQTAETAGLVGLAANQVGFLTRVFVMDFASSIPQNKRGENWTHDWRVIVNPVIKYGKEKYFDWEGCGSMQAGKEALIERSKDVTLSYQDITGENCTLNLRDLLARIAQHEENHLNGILLGHPSQKIRQWRLVK